MTGRIFRSFFVLLPLAMVVVVSPFRSLSCSLRHHHFAPDSHAARGLSLSLPTSPGILGYHSDPNVQQSVTNGAQKRKIGWGRCSQSSLPLSFSVQKGGREGPSRLSERGGETRIVISMAPHQPTDITQRKPVFLVYCYRHEAYALMPVCGSPPPVLVRARPRRKKKSGGLYLYLGSYPSSYSSRERGGTLIRSDS